MSFLTFDDGSTCTIECSYRDDNMWHVGDEVTFSDPDGVERTLTVALVDGADKYWAEV